MKNTNEREVLDLKALRVARGKRTLQQVGDIIGCTRSQVSGYELGKYLPSVPKLVKLLNLYEIKLEDILLKKDIDKRF